MASQWKSLPDLSQEVEVPDSANPALSNLASVAINISLIPDTSGTLNLGSSAKRWSAIYAADIFSNGAITLHADASGVEIYGNGSGSNPGRISLYDADASHLVGFIAPALSETTIWTLPTADGTSGKVLTTNGSAALSFSSTIGNFSSQSSLSGSVVQISAGETLVGSPVTNGLYLMTPNSAALFASPTDASAIQILSGGTTTEEGTGGKIVIKTGDASGVTDGYSENVTIQTGGSLGAGFSGDIVLNPGSHASDADSNGRILVNTIRLKWTGSGGFFQPFVGDAPPAGITPEAGDVYYDTDVNKLMLYNGSTWETVTSA